MPVSTCQSHDDQWLREPVNKEPAVKNTTGCAAGGGWKLSVGCSSSWTCGCGEVPPKQQGRYSSDLGKRRCEVACPDSIPKQVGYMCMIQHGFTTPLCIGIWLWFAQASYHSGSPRTRRCQLGDAACSSMTWHSYPACLQEVEPQLRIFNNNRNLAHVLQNGSSAVHMAARCGHQAVIDALSTQLDISCAITATNGEGKTPLMLACSQLDDADGCVAYLLSAGADAAAEDLVSMRLRSGSCCIHWYLLSEVQYSACCIMDASPMC